MKIIRTRSVYYHLWIIAYNPDIIIYSMKLKFNHVAFTVKNVSESSLWYQNSLDFIETGRYSKKGMDIAILKRDDIRLELFSFGKMTLPLPEYRVNLESDLHTVGTKHLCIEINNLEKSVELLKIKNVNFVTNVDTTAFGGKYIFFRDCNNILIELYEN